MRDRNRSLAVTKSFKWKLKWIFICFLHVDQRKVKFVNWIMKNTTNYCSEVCDDCGTWKQPVEIIFRGWGETSDFHSWQRQWAKCTLVEDFWWILCDHATKGLLAAAFQSLFVLLSWTLPYDLLDPKHTQNSKKILFLFCCRWFSEFTSEKTGISQTRVVCVCDFWIWISFRPRAKLFHVHSTQHQQQHEETESKKIRHKKGGLN